MSTFPAIRPTTRLYVPGNAPSAFANSLSGRAIGFRRGNRRIGQSLSLSFEHLAEADMLKIKNHYVGQDGTFEIFFLSPEIWADHVSPPIPLISDYAWKYTAAPVIADVSFDRFSISVELGTEPIDIGDLVLDGGLASATPSRDYIVNGGLAAATPEREYVISPGGAA
jgi:hypothetical protein